MKTTNVMFIEDRNNCNSLIEFLIKNGVQCFRVRGPIKMREVLENQEIALIVYEEGPGSLKLLEDFSEVWNDYPEKPLVHLYSNASTPINANAEPRFYDSIPLVGSGESLLKIIQKISSFGNSPVQDFVETDKSELSFRHIWKILFRKKIKSGSDRIESSVIRDIPLDTGVSIAERDMLKEKQIKSSDTAILHIFFKSFRSFLKNVREKLI